MRASYFKPKSVTSVRGVWISGEPGIGKSHSIRFAFPGALIKD